MSRPLISIITPSLNRAPFIREAIESVLAEDYPAVEHIVRDAASTDGTLEILRSYPHLRVVSEPDAGMYDAINQGLRMASGEILGLLNTDDLYAPGCFEAVADAFQANPQALAVVGGTATFEDRDGTRQFVGHAPPIAPAELWYRLIQGPPVTNAWFFRRAVFDRIATFDTRFRYSADRYFLIRIALDGGVRPLPIPRELYYYRQHSGSFTLTTLDSREAAYGLLRLQILREDIQALEEFLHREDLPVEVRRRMRREHGERCYRLAATALYHRRWGAAGEAIRRGWGRDALWPWIFAEMASRRALKEIRGHE